MADNYNIKYIEATDAVTNFLKDNLRKNQSTKEIDSIHNKIGEFNSTDYNDINAYPYKVLSVEFLSDTLAIGYGWNVHFSSYSNYGTTGPQYYTHYDPSIHERSGDQLEPNRPNKWVSLKPLNTQRDGNYYLMCIRSTKNKTDWLPGLIYYYAPCRKDGSFSRFDFKGFTQFPIAIIKKLTLSGELFAGIYPNDIYYSLDSRLSIGYKDDDSDYNTQFKFNFDFPNTFFGEGTGSNMSYFLRFLNLSGFTLKVTSGNFVNHKKINVPETWFNLSLQKYATASSFYCYAHFFNYLNCFQSDIPSIDVGITLLTSPLSSMYGYATTQWSQPASATLNILLGKIYRQDKVISGDPGGTTEISRENLSINFWKVLKYINEDINLNNNFYFTSYNPLVKILRNLSSYLDDSYRYKMELLIIPSCEIYSSTSSVLIDQTNGLNLNVRTLKSSDGSVKITSGLTDYSYDLSCKLSTSGFIDSIIGVAPISVVKNGNQITISDTTSITGSEHIQVTGSSGNYTISTDVTPISINGSDHIQVTNSGGNYTISTDITPVSITGAGHIQVTGSGGNYTISTDLNDITVVGGTDISVSKSGNTFTVNYTGLTTEITITGGTDISVTRSGNNYTISYTGLTTGITIIGGTGIIVAKNNAQYTISLNENYIKDLKVAVKSGGTPNFLDSLITASNGIKKTSSLNSLNLALDLSSLGDGLLVVKNGSLSVIQIGNGVAVGNGSSLTFELPEECE